MARKMAETSASLALYLLDAAKIAKAEGCNLDQTPVSENIGTSSEAFSGEAAGLDFKPTGSTRNFAFGRMISNFDKLAIDVQDKFQQIFIALIDLQVAKYAADNNRCAVNVLCSSMADPYDTFSAESSGNGNHPVRVGLDGVGTLFVSLRAPTDAVSGRALSPGVNAGLGLLPADATRVVLRCKGDTRHQASAV